MRSEVGYFTCIGYYSTIHGTDGLQSPPETSKKKIQYKKGILLILMAQIHKGGVHQDFSQLFMRSEVGYFTCIGYYSTIHGTDGLQFPPKD